MKPNDSHQLSFSLRLRERCLLGLHELVHPLYRRWFRRRKVAWQQNVSNLLVFERSSLGYALGEFLSRHRSELIPRFENHDVFHVLLDYGTSVLEESEMQFCLLGSGKRSLYVLGTCAVAWLAFPEFWSKFTAAFRRGEGMRPFYYWYFEYLLGEPLEELRAFIEGGKQERSNARF